MARNEKLSTGTLARGTITGLAVAQAGIAHLGYLARKRSDAEASEAQQARHEAELGRILFRALNRLKGTALKASQLLSMEVGLLPEGVRLQLARGFHQATPLNRALVHKVFRQEFSRDAEQLFQRFDPQAFAAASLGQVHHAELHGGDCEALRRHYVDLAMISPNLSVDEFERELMPALAPLQAWQIAPFRTSRFDFASRSPYPAFEAAQQRKIARYMTGFRDEIPYFERTYLGLNHMLKALGARVSTDNLWIKQGASQG